MRLQPLNRARVASLGDAGRAWVGALPGVLDELCEQWGLTLGRPVPGGSGSYVVRAETASGEQRVVKVATPDVDLTDQARTLGAARGVGYALLHAHDPPRNALLLESLGTALELTPRPPEETLAIVADTLAEAWLLPLDTAPDPAPGDDKASRLHRMLVDLDDRLGHPCPPRARALALDYAARRAAAHDPATCVVVHGDPHPANILRVVEPRDGATSGHVFVDPDGFRADPAYDLGVAVRDWTGRLDVADPRGVIEGYCALLAGRTGIDEQRIWEWGYLERVTTGLFVTSFGGTTLGRRLLDSADLLLG
ncbi:aminoglycoside phosphotransferase family protein [Nocardioides psychrotolerans]|uniref:aminoglycoside phosphotransferase family protein n=1 Tax=Nocardioides psychrotolerans TaxID=1005945 RepID=UPI003137CF54